MLDLRLSKGGDTIELQRRMVPPQNNWVEEWIQPNLRGFLSSPGLRSLLQQTNCLEIRAIAKTRATQAMRSLNVFFAEKNTPFLKAVWLSVIFRVGEKNKGPIL